MSRLYLSTARDEIARRRARAPKGQMVEAWPDLADGATFWLGEETRALLDAAGPPLPVQLSLPDDRG